MNLDKYILLIPLLPLFSFLLLSLSGNLLKPKLSAIIATLLMGISLALSIVVAFEYFTAGKIDGAFQPHIAMQLNWLQFTPNLSINMGLVADPISVMMLLVITIVSAMVHLYSIQYMHGEERYRQYFGYLGLFSFSMLGLVLSINIFQMYIFWELVGVSSFLLIGFYYQKPSAIAAAKKAFIVTRFADLGFLIGILILGTGAKSFDFLQIISNLTQPGSSFTSGMMGVTFLGISSLTWALILVFIGGAGKSAMFPLHIWLPDAMEGPTPVSALIHAATMVVAGVFLVARLFPVFAISAPGALETIAYIGSFTALFAAIIACTQTDIKRVLAYSTISQIAFMIFALGVAGWGEEHNLGYTASMFHLFTHAFFKALLFLGAGAVIHAVNSNEMDGMGGLRKSLPITHITFLIGCLAIAGIPPFSGFFSKEDILAAAEHGNKLVFYVAVLTSALTSFYMFRLYFRIFWNKTPDPHAHNHEKGMWAMNIPLIILAAGAAFAGFIPFGELISADGKTIETPVHIGLALLTVGLGLLSITVAAVLYRKQNQLPVKISNALGSLYQMAYQKFYIDEIYIFITKKIIFNMVGRPAAWFDRNIVDGSIQSMASISMGISNTIKGLQSGRLQSYAMYFVGGLIILVALSLIKSL
jgi:NADH-quinone oxidoreductase subunit L